MFKQLTAITVFCLIGIITISFARNTQSKEACQNDNAEIAAAIAFTESGDIAMHTGNYNEAIEAYTCALDIEPSSFAAYYGRGIAYQEIGNHELAIQDLLMAVDYAGHDNHPELYLHLSNSYTAVNATDEATEFYAAYQESRGLS